ncbi:PTS fructose transporter subunit IIC [Lactobacillus sp. ESL0791]|uniref:PTS fructose transporter subunit IIC n=1 Tax=Lactobacillus sp. ESL0791 TaxID=2983234 RepID=UPI0023F6E534|nr:PTS fructose transporter subunit IIC [Lactobacillus sp. ESL0791]MDF7638338.1 PTS fructose transporter subunit IIC [Lactobacillus sp. ESL0791]
MFKKLQLKKHAMTAISYMLPLVVSAGLLIAIGNLSGGSNITNMNQIKNGLSIPDAFTTLGVWGMMLLAPVISAAIAYSIADRPGIAPGLLSGIISYYIGAGFLGGLLGGFVIGWIVLFLVKYIKVPKWAEGLKPMLIVPLLASIAALFLMFFILGKPIVWLTDWLTEFLQSMQGSAKFLFGGILGGMAAFDFGGPVNKVASLFCDGLLLQGIKGPEAVKILASMVPPFGITLSWVLSLLFKHPIYGKKEEDNIKIAFPMGICMITEGCIPIAMADLVRVVAACTIGAAIGGGMNLSFGVESPVPSGGMFIVPAMTHPWIFCLDLFVGSLITALILLLLKRNPVKEKEDTAQTENDIDLSDIKEN